MYGAEIIEEHRMRGAEEARKLAKLNENKLGTEWIKMTMDAKSEIDSYTLYTQPPQHSAHARDWRREKGCIRPQYLVANE